MNMTFLFIFDEDQKATSDDDDGLGQVCRKKLKLTHVLNSLLQLGLFI